MYVLTTQEYEFVLQRVQQLPKRCEDWLPPIADIKKYIEPHAEEFLPFIVWVLETSDPSTNCEQEQIKDYLRNILNKHLTIIKEGETT